METLVEIITIANRSLYKHTLDEMHRIRYRVAVEEWGWEIPGVKKGYDKDAFDTDDTIYFLAYGDGGDRLVGCARLNPTTKPHLLSEVFPHCCDLSGIPRAEDIYEFSRYIIDHEILSKEAQFRVRGRLSATINRFCIEAGITAVTWFAFQQTYARALPVWETHPLGLPVQFDGDDETYIAAISKMTETGLANLRRAFRMGPGEPPLLLRHPWEEARTYLRLYPKNGASKAVA